MMELVSEAIEFAVKVHDGMRRKESSIPYILHPLEAAVIVSTMTDDQQVIASAVLHDVVEDTDITIDEIEDLKGEGIISGGMIPKVDCCIEAIHKGVKNVVIMDGRVPHSILMEILTDEGAGTMVMGDVIDD